MNYYLVIGGNAVSGEHTIKAIQSQDPDSYIFSTTSGSTKIPCANESIFNIDLTKKDSVNKLVSHTGNKKIKSLVYIPARGTVGKPVTYATREEHIESLDYSVIPMLKLVKALNPELSVWFSGFMWLKPLMLFYGTMTYTKIAMEQLTLKYPDKLKCIRYGMFHSKSVRAIAIMVQRSLKNNLYPEMEDYKNEWIKSKKKFKNFFPAMNYHYEKIQLRKEANSDLAYRPLEARDIQTGIKKALFHKTKPILNVVGDWYWENDNLPDWPKEIGSHLEIIPDDLDKYLKKADSF